MPRTLSPWVGLAIRQRRTASGLTQEQLAEKAELHRTYISMVERGKRNISVDALTGVAEALKTSASQLVRTAERLRGTKSR